MRVPKWPNQAFQARAKLTVGFDGGLLSNNIVTSAVAKFKKKTNQLVEA